MTEGENRPDHTGQPHPSPASAEYSGGNGKIALLGYVCLCLHLFFFGYLFVAAPQSYAALKLEDNWLENLTAVWFLLAGLLLFATARLERHFLRRGIYILGGIAMVFIAGEEVSWGQRIFGFATPDFLLGLNQQDEFNIHNIDLQLTEIILHWGVLILCAITGAAFLCRKDTLLGIPRPSLLTMFGFLVALAYAFPLASRSFYDPTVILSDGRSLLLLFCCYFLLSRQVQWLVISVATGTLVLVFLYVHEHISALDTYAEFEVQEYLAGLVCLFYALELLAWRWAAPGWWAPLASIKLRVARVSLGRRRRRRLELAPEPGASRSPGWTLHFHRSPALWICSLVLVGSVGLALVNLLSYRAAVSEAEAIYRSIVSGTYGDPAGRSTFDVYLDENENRLIYFKEPCQSEDRAQRFFLHVTPVAAEDLPDHRRQHGFDNLDFNFGAFRFGTILEGGCIRTVLLPDYALSRIATGQYHEEEQFWAVQFSPP